MMQKADVDRCGVVVTRRVEKKKRKKGKKTKSKESGGTGKERAMRSLSFDDPIQSVRQQESDH
jgi:hypothetical protein